MEFVSENSQYTSQFIAKALCSGMNFYACRLPGEKAIHFGASPEIEHGIGEGFVFSPFEKHRPMTIANVICDVNDLPQRGRPVYPVDFLPEEDTQMSDFMRGAREIRDYHREHGGKTVLSTVTTGRYHFPPGVLFEYLCNERRDAFVFIFHALGYGIWVGASPELLLKKRDMTYSTMSLAGTRHVSEAYLEWDEKNIHEQMLVTEYITDIFRHNNLNVQLGETQTRIAGNVCHICTPISGIGDTDADVEKLLLALSPTPALCGSDYTASIELIKRYESHRRSLYGGYVGLSHTGGDMDIYVNLRSLCADMQRFCIFAGCGITAESNPLTEWEETRQKANPLRVATEILDIKLF